MGSRTKCTDMVGRQCADKMYTPGADRHCSCILASASAYKGGHVSR